MLLPLVWPLLAGAELRVADVAVRAGTVAQLRVTLSEPVAGARGGFTVDLDPALFEIGRAHV